MEEKRKSLIEQHVHSRKMGMNEEEVQKRKAWLELKKEDEDQLISMTGIVKRYTDSVVESLYEHFMQFSETKKFFEDPEVLNRVKRLQKNYFLRLTGGDYNLDYIEERLKIGAVHASIHLDVKWYLGAYNFYLRSICEKIFQEYGQDERSFAAVASLMKIIFLDIGLAIDTYIFQRESVIRQQEAAIRELSTPILQLREGVLVLPMVGTIDAIRARQLTEQLLYAIRDRRARVAVLDITGVPTVDSQVANHLINTVAASRLMGAKIIVTGLTAGVASTLVRMGIDLSSIKTMGDLQSGVEEADRLAGFRTVKIDEIPDPVISAGEKK